MRSSTSVSRSGTSLSLTSPSKKVTWMSRSVVWPASSTLAHNSQAFSRMSLTIAGVTFPTPSRNGFTMSAMSLLMRFVCISTTFDAIIAFPTADPLHTLQTAAETEDKSSAWAEISAMSASGHTSVNILPWVPKNVESCAPLFFKSLNVCAKHLSNKGKQAWYTAWYLDRTSNRTKYCMMANVLASQAGLDNWRALRVLLQRAIRL
mmetsp:Transcript_86164/g.263745  ORF Transcript_86164/g.263745 Transcript_86164/m.263745 type:complete len:206 (+) Transcript_86164:860-1477(+)